MSGTNAKKIISTHENTNNQNTSVETPMWEILTPIQYKLTVNQTNTSAKWHFNPSSCLADVITQSNNEPFSHMLGNMSAMCPK